MFNSLRSRLLYLASIVLLIGFGLIAWVLDSAYRAGTKSALEEKMQLQLLTLLAAAEQHENAIEMPASLPDPRFNQPSSGLYGYVVNNQSERLWHSSSALGLNYKATAVVDAGVTQFSQAQLDNGVVYIAKLGTIWEQNDQDYYFTFIVIEDSAAIRAAEESFRSVLWLLLTSSAIGLLIVQWFVLRLGLSPLQKIADEIKAIELDNLTQLTDRYPKELSAVARNINHLLNSELAQRTRYKDRMADLAHSLKTPLAILQGMSNSTITDKERQQIIAEQCQRMSQIVDYQLKRAVVGSNQLSVRKVEVKKLVNQVVVALSKVYKAKHVEVTQIIVDDAFFKGDDSDLMEVLGNLLDNAFKYGAGKVQITASNNQDKLLLVVEDNGVGISSDDFSKVLARGTRLDSTEYGQGIGLAMVHEIIKQYNGEISVTDSMLLGAKIMVKI